MSKSLAALENIGNFFGVTRSQSEELKSKTERQIKDGEFGITLKRSQSKQHYEQDKFVHSAKKVLSRIDAFQTFEESHEHLGISDETKRSSNQESVPGTSSNTEKAENHPLTLTTPSQTRSLCKQAVHNKLYTENDDETDIDTGISASRKSKPKVSFESNDSTDSIKDTSIAVEYMDKQLDTVEVTDKPKQDTGAFSDPYKAYKALDKVSNNQANLKEKEQKAKLIFFDELVRPHQRMKKNYLDVPKYSYDSLITGSSLFKDKRTADTAAADNVYKEMRSSPELFLDKMEATGPASEYLSKDQEGLKKCEDNKVKIADPEQKNVVENTKAKAALRVEKEEKQTLSTDTVKSEKTENRLRQEDVVYGKEALKHYKFYLQIERKVEKQRLKTELEERLLEYDWKLAAIDEMIVLAKDYYMNPNSKNAARWKKLKRNVKKSSSHQIGHTEHRRKLGSLPDYRPFFTYFIIFAQLVSFIVICGLHGFTLIGLEPKLSVESGIQTFMGMETIHKWTAPNVWIGPSEKSLIGVGAVFAPCMRSDIQLQIHQSKQNYSIDTVLGCCEISARNVAGTTTQAECEHLTEGVGKWSGGVTCNKRPVNAVGTRHNMKPCCLGVKGQCRLMSHKHCFFLGGQYHLFGPEHCSQVMCLENICKPGHVAASSMLPWQPESPAQWWRVPLSLLYHHGIIQLLVVMGTQWFLLTQIEVTAGWFRMLVIYVISGTLALLTSGIMLPYQAHVGGVGAICGMVGVVLVELIHFWKLVHRPMFELLKLTVIIIVLFSLGTLPYLDIFGIITGLVSGALCGIIFLPYITFGRWHLQLRVVLIVISSGVLMLICYFLLHLFGTVQSVESCEGCKKLNCVPYTEKMCDTSLWQQF